MAKPDNADKVKPEKVSKAHKLQVRANVLASAAGNAVKARPDKVKIRRANGTIKVKALAIAVAGVVRAKPETP
jgi:hypothetical protein